MPHMLGHGDCDGTCGQGEGDCDRDSDCLPGLVCKFEWSFGADVCRAGTISLQVSDEIHRCFA